MGRFMPLRIQKADMAPSVSIIISAYNEEKNIERKLKNTLALAYPTDKIEVLIGSDGSTDDTVGVANKFANQTVLIFDFHENRGKTAVQDDLVNSSKGDILIFTDAASFLPKYALKKLVRNFADDRVGCVAGRLRFVDTDANLTTESQGLYWRYEIKIRKLESRIGSLIGVDGPLYAVKRQYYIPLENNMISDLMTPLLVLEQGKKVILEPDAIVDETPTIHPGQEFTTRRRITLRGLVGIFSHMRLLNPLKHPILAFQIFFHKVLRWFIGPLVIINFLACLALSGLWFFKLFLLMYTVFILTALFGWVLDKFDKKVNVFTVPYYFSLVNFAATMGIFDFFRNKQAVSWKPVRH
jgi:cellulose synthase/poly-beta-1,6-N-acetylglucosamine synthase-like glycosyltransferase